jgi:hypothetical protein
VAPDGSCPFVPGCNLAVRRAAFERAGTFDPRRTATYDDVDFCLRLTAAGGSIGYAARAAVRHHRRDSVAGFLRQQRTYAASEPPRSAPGGESHFLPRPRRRLWSRLDPRRPRYVFTGPQACQLFILTAQPLHTELPLKAAAAVLAGGAALVPAAARRQRLGGLAAVWAGMLAALFALVAIRVPARPSPDPLTGLLVRLTTAALWFAQPLVRRRSVPRG